MLSSAMQQHIAARRLQHKRFHLFNIECGAFLAQPTSQNTATILEHVAKAWPTPPLRLYTPMLKQKNLSLVLSKATELGVTEFQLMTTQHSQVHTINTTRLEGICKEAVEQSERFTLPIVHPPCALKQCLDVASEPILVALERCSHKASPPPCSHVLLGPEGGFSAEERSLLMQHPLCHTISLGCAILRAETAAICCVYHAQLALSS